MGSWFFEDPPRDLVGYGELYDGKGLRPGEQSPKLQRQAKGMPHDSPN